jgi:tetratricopeptide (TPR) repeat protein
MENDSPTLRGAEKEEERQNVVDGFSEVEESEFNSTEVKNLPERPSIVLRSILVGVIVVIVALVVIFQRQKGIGNRKIVENSNIMPTDNEKKNPNAEIAHLEALWHDHPNHAPIALQLGHLYALKDDHTTAIKYYEEYLKIDTSATRNETRLDLAREYFAIGMVDQAKSEMMALLKLDKVNPGALYNLGAINANLGDFKSATRYWEELVKVHPDDSLAIVAKQSLLTLKSMQDKKE